MSESDVLVLVPPSLSVADAVSRSSSTTLSTFVLDPAGANTIVAPLVSSPVSVVGACVPDPRRAARVSSMLLSVPLRVGAPSA